MGAGHSQMPEEGTGPLPSPPLPSPAKGILGRDIGRGGGWSPVCGVVLGVKGHGKTRDQSRDECGEGTRTICQNPQLSESRLN